MCLVAVHFLRQVYRRVCLVCILAVSVTGTAGCGSAHSSGSDFQLPALLPVHVVIPVRVDRLRTTEVCFGKLMARRSVPLAFQRSGRIGSVSCDVGDQVSRGQILATLASPGLENRQRELESALRLAQSSETRSNRVEELQQQLSQLTAESRTTTIIAPFDGIVTRCQFRSGQTVAANENIVQLADPGQLILRASLPGDVANGLLPNQTIWAQIDGQAVICDLDSPAEARGSVHAREIVLRVPNSGGGLEQSLGRVFEVRFFVELRQSGYWLPLSALRRSRNEFWGTQVVVDQFVRRQDVKVLKLEDEFAFVASEGFDSAAVIVNGGHRVAEGQRVRLVDVSSEYRSPVSAFEPELDE